MRKMADSVVSNGLSPKNKDSWKYCQFCALPVCKNCTVKLYKLPKSDEVGQICPCCEAKMLLKLQFDVTRSQVNQVRA